MQLYFGSEATALMIERLRVGLNEPREIGSRELNVSGLCCPETDVRDSPHFLDPSIENHPSSRTPPSKLDDKLRGVLIPTTT